MNERDQRSTTPLPSEFLLNQVDTPTIAIRTDGIVAYANSACERMLGYQCAASLQGQSLAALLVGASHGSPRDSFELLRDRDTVTNWNHSDGYPVAAMVSTSMLLRGADLMLMVTLTDVTHWVSPG